MISGLRPRKLKRGAPCLRSHRKAMPPSVSPRAVSATLHRFFHSAWCLLAPPLLPRPRKFFGWFCYVSRGSQAAPRTQSYQGLRGAEGGGSRGDPRLLPLPAPSAPHASHLLVSAASHLRPSVGLPGGSEKPWDMTQSPPNYIAFCLIEEQRASGP